VRQRRSRRDLLPVLLIAGGVLWLLFQTGFVPPRALSTLAFYWPLLLIGVGLDLLRARRPWTVPYTGLAVLVVVLAAIVLPPPGAGTSLTRFREPVDAARAASVRLELSSAPTHVFAAPDGAALLDAEIRGRPAATFDVRGGRDKTVTVRARDRGPWPPTSIGTRRWDLGLGRSLPLDLTVDGGSGAATLDLDGLQLTALRTDVGSGSVTLSLPGQVERYRARVDGGSGAARIAVPSGASLELALDTGSGPTQLTLPPSGRVVVTLRSGSGPVTIDVPDGAAARLEVRDDGSGPLRVASFLTRRSGSGDTGVWESGGATGAPADLLITVASAGSGSITIR